MSNKNTPLMLKAEGKVTSIDAMFMRNLIAGKMLKAYDEQLFAEPITLEHLDTLAAIGSAFAALTEAMVHEKAIEEAAARIAMMKGATTNA